MSTSILLKKVLIHSPGSSQHGKRRDVLIQKGIIEQIGASIDAGKSKVVSGKDLHLSPGCIDLRVNFRDPGEEYKEDIQSGLDAAAAGGFTRVVVMPSTTKPADNKSVIQYMQSKSAGHVVSLLPAGTLSEKQAGLNLSDMYDMQQAGAVLFTDDKHSVERTELMHLALDYARTFRGLIMSFPFDSGINPGGQMHEGKMSTSLGMKGIPAIAESLRLQRDIELLRYTGGRMHVSLLSTSEGVDLVRKAKKEGLKITADVSAAQLNFLDKDLEGFDAAFKMLPPFRDANHRKALIKGLMDGTIDAICSDHCPQDIEQKRREFEHADFGGSLIEMAFSSALEALGNAELVMEKLSIGPRKVLGLPIPVIEVGAEAELSVFDAGVNWVCERKALKSRSYISPYNGRTLQGKALMVIRNGKHS